ncbi:MAG: AsmA family protein [Deltaproteobacteria bacterium]|nr:AsmA family protein [Deltaproteobacteria bacterium]
MKSPRNIVLVILAVVAIALGGLVQYFNVIAGRRLERVQQELQKFLGKEVTFVSLEVNLLGTLGFAAKEFRVADDPRFAATPAVRAKELILGVSLWELLFRRVVIDSLTLKEPELQIISDETELLNLTELINKRQGLAKLPKAAAGEPRQSSVSFAVSELRIEDGRVEYLDRSIKVPAELRLKNLSLKISGFDPTVKTRISLTAALSEATGQDVRIDGQFNPGAPDISWSQRGIDMSIQFDSLHVPVVARAIAALRDKIPRELDVTGPMSLQAKVSGTLARPRIDNLTLKAPLFGSSDYNAIVTGQIEFSERRTWEDAKIQGKLTLESLPVARLLNLRMFQQRPSATVAADGKIGIYSRFEGTWNTLRVGALVRADKSELRYKDWLHKPANQPMEIRTQISRQKQKYLFHESTLVSGANKIVFSGNADLDAEAQLHLKLASNHGTVAGWSELFSPAAYAGIAGQVDLNIAVDKRSLPGADDWGVRGQLRLNKGAFNHRQSGQKIEAVTGTIVFAGQQARFENMSFRLGASTLAFDAVAANLLEPNVAYRLRSAQFNLADLPALDAAPKVQLHNLSAKGTIQYQRDMLVLDGTITASDGKLQEIDFRDLRSAIAFSAAGLSFKNLSLRTLGGILRADGYLSGGTNPARVELTAQSDGLDLRALAAQLYPPLQNKLTGQLNGRARLITFSKGGANTEKTISGSGEAAVQAGAIKDFNLVSQLLLRGSGTTVSTESTARLPPGFAKLVSQPDTSFDSLKADFTMEPERIRTENLVIVTPEYTITGAGWIGFDRSTKWNGLIALSPKVTQEVQRDYRLLRYLVDRRGRLAITFRADGTIPNVKIRLDNRALAQALRGSSPERSEGAETEARSDPEPRDGKTWLPDALDRFLNR